MIVVITICAIVLRKDEIYLYAVRICIELLTADTVVGVGGRATSRSLVLEGSVQPAASRVSVLIFSLRNSQF